MKTWKDIERARERRLWITQVLFPGFVMGATAWSIPEVRQYAKEKYNQAKNFIKSKLPKKETT